ncbi:GGDEF domain-containing protein [Sphaerotilus sp.]|jgi:diguanylate cyclase (GGDEF)-like protein|uniref:GGDEF domain-containing protein n=1 Tax=Sphaerotilus sp. TaxID=2093942 RepID=UPI0025D0E764|nr:GGDEF domain-containing protein [Sphaerotilus sp.]
MTNLLRLDELDSTCRVLWRSGAVGDCRLRAAQLIERAVACDDVLAQARGWLHRAQCDQHQSAYLDMLEAARRAMALLRVGDADRDLVQAQALACTAAAVLNRTDEAIEAGLLAQHLADDMQDTDDRLLAAEALALAFVWAGQNAAAQDCFDRALESVRQSGSAGRLVQWLIERACAQVWHCIRQDERGADAPACLAVQATVAEVLQCCDATPGGLHALVPRAGRFQLGWVQVLLTCWRGETERARVQLASIRPLTQDERPWLDLLAVWAAAEIALKQRAWPAAEASARRVFDEAHRLSHEALAEQGAQMLVHLLLGQGKHAQALDVARESAQRRHGGHARALPGHARLAQFFTQTRARELQQRTRLSLPPDDSLTGLHARGYFLQLAQEMLRTMDLSRARCSVLQIGVTGLQTLAERHAPLIRDRVLCAVARLLRETLRAGDLPARWTHDEFAVLLHRSSADDTARVCQRIAEAVLAHDWSALTGGLVVQVSISHAQARPGDTIETLMRRCDEEMRAGRLQHQQIAA